MGLVLLALLILAMAGHSSASWCVCKPVSDDVLQKAIDYACGAGADCNPIRPNGQCYNPNSVRNHCSYAVNSYYQRKAAYGATCDFGGTAMLVNSNPSDGTCAYPASSSTAGTGTATPVTTVPTTTPTTPTTTPVTPVSGAGTSTGVPTGTNPATGTTPTTGTSPTTISPYTTTPAAGTPSGGVLGGVGTGLAPTGSSMDDNHGGVKLETTTLCSALLALVISGIVWWWN
ncbi:hypothetical protein Cgig2_006077 [Carnegiea gigantea]|uniref:X8 domain-containing protein n=1 Tax=Carnegiea gigantea TaxID=171969 RepID=A0A9Q1KYV6_9CARY|nr:hypothetical protein Cgig2_006077 [Carnegiea gigantea]